MQQNPLSIGKTVLFLHKQQMCPFHVTFEPRTVCAQGTTKLHQGGLSPPDKNAPLVVLGLEGTAGCSFIGIGNEFMDNKVIEYCPFHAH